LSTFFKKWWFRATPDYHYRDFAKAVVRILSTLIRVFASLFAKSEWVSGQRPENLKKRKMCFAHSLQMSVSKKVTEKFLITLNLSPVIQERSHNDHTAGTAAGTAQAPTETRSRRDERPHEIDTAFAASWHGQ
jgi:hypothetical protein